MRGNYATEGEADQSAEKLIREVDSYHPIHHAYVGRPFPLAEANCYSASVQEVDIRSQTAKSMSTSIAKKKQEEGKRLQEVKNKRLELEKESARNAIEDREKDEEELLDDYTTLRVKRGHLRYKYCSMIDELHQLRKKIIKFDKEVVESDEDHPTFINLYSDKLLKAREEAGYNDNEESIKSTFLEFVLDKEHTLKVPTIDSDEVIPELPFEMEFGEI